MVQISGLSNSAVIGSKQNASPPAVPPAYRMNKDARMELDLSSLHEIPGFLGACIVDSRSGVTLSSIAFGEEIDMDRAGAANSDVIKATHREINSMGFEDELEDILISLGNQYHLIRPVTHNPSVFVYVAVDRLTSNLAFARSQVRAVERTLRVS